MIEPEYNFTQIKVEDTFHYLVTKKITYRVNSKFPLNKEQLIEMVKQNDEINSLSLKPYIPAPLENE